ncbi:MAG: GNAT family N-acetyltransferase [Anaerolineae bacterium]|nr:GNAT family N-acetyltransferase [Anaerolineae bacterium]
MPAAHSTSTLTIEVKRGELLSDGERRNIVALCSLAYEEDMEPVLRTFADPTHVLGFCDGLLVSHALWITRFLQPGHLPPLRTAYVEAVATHPAWRRRGFAVAVMRRLVAEVQDFDLAALSPADGSYYARLGWEAWQGPLFIRTQEGLQPSPDDEEVMIFRLPRTPPLDLTQPLSAEWREGELW